MDPPPPPIPISHHHHHHHPGLPHGIDTDPNFEPQQRSRANTWPLPRPDNIPETEEGMTLQNVGGEQPLSDPSKTPDPVQVPKKNSSRRNAWGNMSYADLITQAIQNSPDKRLTLSQIYDWMVQNIPYFKDKGDSNSSAGWKNSIRHNLSLHNRFMRVQNESTGKSSWWMINPDAKPGKSARRRATSMETSKYEKKRGRVRKKVEALRNGLEVTTSPASSLSEGLDLFPDSPFNSAYQLSPGDFRPRASSNASSCGRLSPIPAVESESPGTAMSPLSWSQYSSGQVSLKYVIDQQTSGYGTEQLVDNLVGSMKIEGTYMGECAGMKQPSQNMSPASQVGVIGNSGFITSNSPYQTNSSFITSRFSDGLSKLGSSLPRSPQQRIMGTHGDLSQFGISALQQNLAGDLPVNNSPPPQGRMDSIGSHSVGSYSPDLTPQQRESTLLAHLTSPSFNPVSSYPEPMLRAALTQKDISVRQMLPPLVPIGNTSTNPSPSQMMGHFMGALNANNALPSDIDFSLENFQGGLDCNVDEVIKHELSMEGSFDTLDFFPTNGTTNGGQTPMDIGHHGNSHQGSPLTVGQTQVPSLNNPLTSTRSWVR